ncbi:NAD(P)H-dependent oxidoreductase [Enterococcus sp. HY326]|uniref:NAD(P)H-dependent oxidoreductase n=1 Tax=Enterococcus sp. HY326 TaxID=2971265 RepID=UPI00223FA2B1|nr:NAD(P)H-dependent oxidoreductase [Enterococcus sp. HY326]
MKNIFLNASMNKAGHGADLAKEVFGKQSFETINLIDYQINQIGQNFKGDQYFDVIDKLSGVNQLVISTPVYWSDMTGYLKTFIDRLSDTMDIDISSKEAPLNGAKLILIVQGTAPDDAIPGIETVIKHVARRFFMKYLGKVTTSRDAKRINFDK